MITPPSLHQRFALVQVEEVAEEHVVDEQGVHYGVDVVRPQVGNAEEEHVGLARNRHDHLLVVVLQGLGVDRAGGAGLNAGHPVRGFYGLEDPTRDATRHRLRRLVVGEEVRPRQRTPLVLGLSP